MDEAQRAALARRAENIACEVGLRPNFVDRANDISEGRLNDKLAVEAALGLINEEFVGVLVNEQEFIITRPFHSAHCGAIPQSKAPRRDRCEVRFNY